MSRMSKEAILAAERERQDGINREVETRLAALLPDMVAKATGIAFGQLTEKLNTARAGLGPDAAPVAAAADQALLEGLAHAMAKASDPGNKRRIVPPEVMKERAQARERMMALIINNHAKGVVPIYKVVGKTFLSEILIDPQYLDGPTKKMVDQQINWSGQPNQAMVPVDDAAKAVHREYLLSISKKPIDETKLPKPWVMTAGQIMQGASGAERAAASPSPMGVDPRRLGHSAKEQTLHILGTTAQPAVVSR